MITEDYCSYEVAKLLKEKGFNEGCRSYFINDFGDYRRCTIEITDKDCTTEQILRPTLQMAMKWLREEKEIFFCIHPDYPVSKDYMIEFYNADGEPSGIFGNYKTYEDAVKAALKYSLENLI